VDFSWLPEPGSVLAARYRLISLLGTGGMAAVLMAEQVEGGERVAIKFLHPAVAAHAESHQRFLREARISSLIQCDHVVRTLDAGTTPAGLSYLVMEYLEGEDLSARVSREGPLPVALAVDCVLQAAEALALAHAAGIVHRDIKPSNLWLSRRADGAPFLKVLDFGISKLAAQASTDPSLTETASVFGSPTYMPPEQIRSAKRVDARADIWSLGVVLHELLTRRLPFEGDNVGGILASITADAPMNVRAIREDIPVAVEDVVLACLEKDPARRISLAELSVELRPFASATGAASADRVLSSAAGAPSTWRTRGSRVPPATGASTLSAATIRMEPGPVRRARLTKLVLGATTVAALGVAGWWTRTAPPVPPVQPATTLSAAAPPFVVPASSASLVSAPASANAPALASSSLPLTAPSGTPRGAGKHVPSTPKVAASAAAPLPLASATPAVVAPKPPAGAPQVSDDRR